MNPLAPPIFERPSLDVGSDTDGACEQAVTISQTLFSKPVPERITAMKKETSCISSAAVLRYVKRHRPEAASGFLKDLGPEFDGIDNAGHYLADSDNWISCAAIAVLYRRARQLFNDPHVALKIGMNTSPPPRPASVQWRLTKPLWPTRKLVARIQEWNDTWERNKSIEVVRLHRNSAVLRLHWDPAMGTTKDHCLYNQGSFAVIPQGWGDKPSQVNETCCHFEGAAHCEFHLQRPSENQFKAWLTGSLSSKQMLRGTLREMEKDKGIIAQKYDEVAALNLALKQKVNQLTAIQETSKAILSVLDLEPLLKVIMRQLAGVCQIQRAVIMLANEDEQRLEYLHGIGFGQRVPEDVRTYTIPLNRVSNLIARVAITGSPEYIENAASSGLKKDNVIIFDGRLNSAFVVPLINRDRVIGVIAADSLSAGGFAQETRETLELFASQIAIAIENARLYSRLNRQMRELKQSQRLLCRVEKFSFLGSLAARLAHEIKNPMTAIGTFLQMLPHRYEDEEFRNEFQSIALEETRRVNRLITELLDLVNKRESRFEITDIHSLINKMTLLISPQSKSKRITIQTTLAAQEATARVDTGKVKQVILNLLSNAVESTPDEGTIHIETSRMEVQKEAYLQVVISDSGPGIPEEIADKIFDPYFTTKHKSAMHNGTGLGLFIAHQHMLDHGGSIELDTSCTQGASFILKFPLQYNESRQLRREEITHAEECS